MENKQNVFVAYGLISGFVLIVFTLLLYLGGVKWFVNPISLIGWVIPIIIAVLAAVKQKRNNGGFLTFSEALKGIFLVFVISGLFSTLFSFVLFNYIDVPFREALTQRAAEMTEKMYRNFGMEEEAIDKAVEGILSGESYSAGQTALGFAIYCIIYFIIALITAAIVKKKKPEFADSSFNR